MDNKNYDYIILGQGLAGTALAWELYWLGVSFLIVDRDEDVTTSKVAAGLVTPVTGQRLVPSWNFLEFRPVAERFYQWVESETKSSFFRPLTMVRLFQSEKEQTLFEKKRAALAPYISLETRASEASTPLVDAACFKAPWGGFEMPEAAQLQTVSYLKRSQEFFEARGLYKQVEVDLNELRFEEQVAVSLPSLELSASRIVLCQGKETFETKWFKELPFKPAKGEILTLRISGLTEQRVVNSGLWMVPEGSYVYRVGSTYEWDELDQVPTVSGRDEICRRLTRFLKLPFEVLEHTAAVRPSMEDQKPVLGCHPDLPQLCLFNGLGSKGSLLAPYFAKQLVDHLEQGKSLNQDVDVQLRMQKAKR